MVGRIIGIFFNLFARAIETPRKRDQDTMKGTMFTYRGDANYFCDMIAKAAGLPGRSIGSQEAVDLLTDLGKKRQQLMVLIAAVENVAPALKDLTQKKKWYQRILGKTATYEGSLTKLDLKKNIDVLLDVLNRIKDGGEDDRT